MGGGWGWADDDVLDCGGGRPQGQSVTVSIVVTVTYYFVAGNLRRSGSTLCSLLGRSTTKCLISHCCVQQNHLKQPEQCQVSKPRLD